MKKATLFLIGNLFLSFISYAQDSSFTINGQLEKIKSGTIFLNIYKGSETLRDSTVITDGNFKFAGYVSSPSFAVLTIPVKQDDYFTFYIEPVTMSITGRKNEVCN